MLTVSALPGVLFDSQQDWSSTEPWVDLQQPAVMKLAGLWLCIRDSLNHSNLPATLQPALSTKVDLEECLPLDHSTCAQLKAPAAVGNVL